MFVLRSRFSTVFHGPVRCYSKHWKPEFKDLRRRKVRPVKLPDFNLDYEKLTEEETRSYMKERGVEPNRYWNERQVFIASTSNIFEPYVPPEGDGKASTISTQGAKQKYEFVEKKSKSMMAIRKIRQYEDTFETPEFCNNAVEIYRKAHELMSEKNKEEIQDYVTEKAYGEILHNTDNKTIRWQFIKSLDLPRLVHARTTDLITNTNIFAQITVRLHTQQTLAVYDRFGRLMYGSETTPKDVLEYVVFEKHMANVYGKWRIHDKIVPDWVPRSDPSSKTQLIDMSEIESVSEANIQTT